jgi:threonine dehydratase
VTIPEKPGSFKKFCHLLGHRNITEFNYRYADREQAHIFVGVSIHNRAEATRLTEMLERHELPALDLTDDEMAKSHVRYMVGGHAPQADNEVLYRFAFPERPGALLNFLDNLRSDWNISLFHYRNHGADFGRVLVGMQVPPADRAAFQGFLDRLGYEYVEESGNPAYRMFLG